MQNFERFTIGYAIRRDREQAGLSQTELATLAGVSRRHVSNIEGNTVGISSKTATKLFGVLTKELNG